MGFGSNLRRRRRELGMTQEQLAARTGIRQGTISTIERDERTPNVYLGARLAAGVECPLDDLVDTDETEEEEQRLGA